MKLKRFIINIMIPASIMVSSCHDKNKDIQEHEQLKKDIVEMTDDQVSMAEIKLGKIESRELTGMIRANGMVKALPGNLYSVTAVMGGYVQKCDLMPGCKVIKGQILATISNQEFIELQQNYLEAKNKLQYAETDLGRQGLLRKENINSAKTLQLAESEYKILKTRVSALAQKLSLAGINALDLKEDALTSTVNILSPVSGFVKSVNINCGKYVSSTDVMFEIINNDQLMLELTIFEKDIDKISHGQKVLFSSPDRSGLEMHAEITEIGKNINEENTIQAFALVKNTGNALLPGMYVNSFILTENNSTLSLPDEAFVNFEDKTYIFIYSGKRQEGKKMVNDYKMLNVKKGISYNGFTEIILPKGFDTLYSGVVIRGAYNLLSALKNGGEMAC